MVNFRRKSGLRRLSVLSKISRILAPGFRILSENWQFGEYHFQVSKACEEKTCDETRFKVEQLFTVSQNRGFVKSTGTFLSQLIYL